LTRKHNAYSWLSSLAAAQAACINGVRNRMGKASPACAAHAGSVIDF
jgi:hypothetical protein